MFQNKQGMFMFQKWYNKKKNFERFLKISNFLLATPQVV